MRHHGREGNDIYDLRDMVARIHAELARLREENEALSAKVRDLVHERYTFEERSHGRGLENIRLMKENDRLRSAIRWALGEEGEFPERPEGNDGYLVGPYWWRKELRARAAIADHQGKGRP